MRLINTVNRGSRGEIRSRLRRVRIIRKLLKLQP